MSRRRRNAWLMAVAAPTDEGPELLDPGAIEAFLIPGDVAVMLHVGTWHAGPLFEGSEQSFFNLELSDTNEVDHQSAHFTERTGISLVLVDGD